MRYRSLVITTFLFIAPSLVLAGEATISWTPPTICADGSPLNLCPTSGFRIYGALIGQVKLLLASPPATATSHLIANLAPGNWCFDMTTLAGLSESVRSNEACKTVPAPAPNPPNITGVTAVAVVPGINMAPVYKVQNDGSRGAAVVGFVPLWTPCAGSVLFSYRSQAYRRVDSGAVRWWGAAQTGKVAAACG